MEVYTAAEMRLAGFSERDLRLAVAAGDILRIRRDRYAAPDSDPAAVEAIRIGGVLGCVSALRDYGIWVTERRWSLHVHLPPNASRLRRGTSTRHWEPLISPPSRTRVSVLDALVTAVRCQPFVAAIASIDSALNRGLVRMSDLAPHLQSGNGREVLALCDGRADSGLETHVRVPLVRLGLRVTPQARILGVGRGDILVEDCVLVETDGAEFHGGRQWHIDHLRDATATIGGLTVLRFDPTQVHVGIESVVRSVVEAVITHRWSRFSGQRAEALRRRIGSHLWA